MSAQTVPWACRLQALHGAMPEHQPLQSRITGNAADVAHIARPESVVLLAATVRAARELHGRERIDGLKERVSDGS